MMINRLWATVFLLALLFDSALAGRIPFAGPGLNTHGQMLPIAPLKAAGVRWVRADLPVRDISEKRVRGLNDWYGKGGIRVLWVVTQMDPQPGSTARKMASWGCEDLELGNEPEQGQFNPGGRVWSGAEYGAWFARVKSAIGKKVRTYGPATGTYDVPFISAARRAGMNPAAISWHGYWKRIEELPGVYSDIRKRFGMPGICTEVSFGDHGPGKGFGDAYPEKRGAVLGYLVAKDLLRSLPWCVYDGPNANVDKTVGWFDESAPGRWDHWTDTLRGILGVRGGFPAPKQAPFSCAAILEAKSSFRVHRPEPRRPHGSGQTGPTRVLVPHLKLTRLFSKSRRSDGLFSFRRVGGQIKGEGPCAASETVEKRAVS